MTNQEAIKILKDTLYDEKTPTDYLEAVKMGRESLENQTSVIAELEKIKARLNHRANEHLDGDYYVRIKDINEVFAEELAKLKGE